MILKNTQQSSFDEIKRSIPAYYLDFSDYMAIQRFVADEMDSLAEQALKIIDNAFIFRCDEDTIDELERFLNIFDIERRITDRSIYVNSVLTSVGKLSVSKMKRWIESVLHEAPEIDFTTDDKGNRILHFKFDNHSDMLNDLIELITQRLPAHVTVVCETREDMDATPIYYETGVMVESGYETIPIKED